MGDLFIFGNETQVQIHDEKRKFSQLKLRSAFFIGNVEDVKHYWLIVPNLSTKVITRGDVICDEGHSKCEDDLMSIPWIARYLWHMFLLLLILL